MDSMTLAWRMITWPCLAVAFCGMTMATLGHIKCLRILFRILGGTIWMVVALSAPVITAMGLFEGRLTTSFWGFLALLLISVVALLIESAMLSGIILMTVGQRDDKQGIHLKTGSMADRALRWCMTVNRQKDLTYGTGPCQTQHGDSRSICNMSWIASLNLILFWVMLAVYIVCAMITILFLGRLPYFKGISQGGRLTESPPFTNLVLAAFPSAVMLFWIRAVSGGEYTLLGWIAAFVMFVLSFIGFFLAHQMIRAEWVKGDVQRTRVGRAIGKVLESDISLPSLPDFVDRAFDDALEWLWNSAVALKTLLCPMVIEDPTDPEPPGGD